MDYTRREFGKIALATATLPLASWKLMAAAKPNSIFGGVQIGTITYSFRSLPGSAEETLKYCLDCGISGDRADEQRGRELCRRAAQGRGGGPGGSPGGPPGGASGRRRSASGQPPAARLRAPARRGPGPRPRGADARAAGSAGGSGPRR